MLNWMRYLVNGYGQVRRYDVEKMIKVESYMLSARRHNMAYLTMIGR